MTQRDLSSLQGLMLARMFAEEIGLAQGNLWEPAISRSISQTVADYGLDAAVDFWRCQLGLVGIH